MKNIILTLLVALFSFTASGAKASVCLLTGYVGGDSIVSIECDGKETEQKETSLTVTLNNYLNQGYKIAGQSGGANSAGVWMVWTLSK